MKQLFSFTLMLLFSSVLLAQQPKNAEQREARREKMESMKIAHIAQKLNLDPKTAEVFWPVYNQYENEMRSLIQATRAQRNGEDFNVDEMLDREQKALDIKKKFTTQFNKILKPEQVTGLFQAEKEFRQMLMRKARVQQGNMRETNQRPAMRR
jgi:hypothetical protein